MIVLKPHVGASMPEKIESGDIYFFYRNKVDIDRASDLGDIQRTYMILAPDNARKARLFVIGKKRLPDGPCRGGSHR